MPTSSSSSASLSARFRKSWDRRMPAETTGGRPPGRPYNATDACDRFPEIKHLVRGSLQAPAGGRLLELPVKPPNMALGWRFSG